MSKLKAGEEVSMRKTKRVVESMVDLILEEEQLLIGMTSIKDYDEYTYNHSVNVSILSVALRAENRTEQKGSDRTRNRSAVP